MQVKDLPRDTPLPTIRLRVPMELVTEHALPSDEMYVAGTWRLGVWLKQESTKDGRLFPVTRYNPDGILEWEVISKG